MEITYSPAWILMNRKKITEQIRGDEESSRKVLMALSKGVGGNQLVAKYGTLLNATDEKLLIDWLDDFPLAKVELMAQEMIYHELPVLKSALVNRLEPSRVMQERIDEEKAYHDLITSANGLVFIGDYPAESWEQVNFFLEGDEYSRSKIKILVNGEFHAIRLEKS